MTCYTSPTGPVPMPIGRPNVAGIRGPGPICRQINRFRCFDMLINVRRTKILRFAKLLGLSPRPYQTIHHQLTHRQSSLWTSTVIRRFHECVWLPWLVAIYLCRCRYRASPRIMSHRISGSRLWSRLSGIHHRLVPGRQSVAWIWPPLTPSVRIGYNGLPSVCGRCGLSSSHPRHMRRPWVPRTCARLMTG